MTTNRRSSGVKTLARLGLGGTVVRGLGDAASSDLPFPAVVRRRGQGQPYYSEGAPGTGGCKPCAVPVYIDGKKVVCGIFSAKTPAQKVYALTHKCLTKDMYGAYGQYANYANSVNMPPIVGLVQHVHHG